MSKHFVHSSLAFSFALATFACSTQKTDKVITTAAKAAATSSNTTQATLEDLAPDEESKATFDFTKPYEIAFSGSSKLIFAHGDGHTITYDAALKAWSSTVLSSAVADHDIYYDFLDQGHLGLKAAEISLRIATGNTLIATRPDGLTNDSKLGFNPGFAGSLDKTNLTTVRTDGTTAKIFRSATFLATMKQVYPCNVACALWSYDGTKVQTLGSDGTWRDLALPAPIEANLGRLAIYFNPDAKTVPTVQSLVAVSATGALKIYASVPTKAAPTWEDVKLISDRFCVSCHLDDGFDKQATWSALKTSMITRLQTTDKAVGPMPPPETLLGKEMGAHDKSVLVTFLQGIDATTQGTIGGSKDPPADSPTSGDLKVLGDKYCLGCHADSKNLIFWTGKQADIVRRVGIANMPKNSVMPEVDKKKLLDLVNAL